MKRNFNDFLLDLRNSIADYNYYIDFDKVHRNVDALRVELNILNSLIGSKNIEDDFEKLIIKYPDVLKCIPLLIAVRANEIYCQDENGAYLYKFNLGKDIINDNVNLEQYKYFMRKVGLFDLFEKRIINNLVDYVTGVETGLDSNGRKNRGGHLMEDFVERYILKAGFKKNVNYFKEMYIQDITEIFNIDLASISNGGRLEKRFDFVIKTDNMIYALETTFYTTTGSKLNETARSYKMIGLEANSIKGFTFIWITDGIGWLSARNNLEDTFNFVEHVYNIKDLEDGILEKVLL